MTVALDLFGVVHVDRFSIVRSELHERAAAADVDALFLEYPAERPDLGDWIRALVRLPPVVVGYAIYGVLSFAMYVITARGVRPSESRAAEEVGEALDVPVHSVDPHVRVIWSAGGGGLVVANWLLVAGVVFVGSPLQVVGTCVLSLLAFGCVLAVARRSRRLATATAVPVFVVWFVLQIVLGSAVLLDLAAVVFVAVTYWTIDERNAAMLDRAGKLATANEYDRAMLLTGRAHVGGLRNRIGERTEIEGGTIWIRRLFRRGTLQNRNG